MKIIHYSIFRALCSIAVGALLVKYREDMVTWMTILVGVLFFVSGFFAVLMAIARKRAANALYAKIEESGVEDPEQPMPKPGRLSVGAMVAGTGSMLLGIILSTMPNTFVHFLVYILSAFLIIGAIQQFFTLATARSFGKVGFGWWVMPLLLFVAGCVALFKPDAIASFPLLFIGYSMVIYGVVECVNAFKARSNRKQAEKFHNLNEKPDFSEAEEVAYEEVK